jgi:uncharacterized protein (TIRG00374 family)
MQKKCLFRTIKKLLPIIGIVILPYLIYTIGIDKITSTLMKISPIHIIAVVFLSIPLALISNTQWQMVLRKQRIKIGFFDTLKISFISGFYRAITPGKIGGYINLLYLKEKSKEPYGKLFTNNMIFSVIDNLSLFCLLFASSLILINKISILFPILCIVFTIYLIAIFFFYKKERGEKAFHFLISLFIPKRVKKHFIKFTSTFYNDFPTAKGLVLPFLIQIPLTILAYSQLYIIAISLGIQIPYHEFILICPIISLITKIPISPGALGIRELTAVYLFSFYGVDPAISVVLSLAGYLTLNLPSICLGAILALKWNHDDKKNHITRKISSAHKKPNLDFR